LGDIEALNESEIVVTFLTFCGSFDFLDLVLSAAFFCCFTGAVLMALKNLDLA